MGRTTIIAPLEDLFQICKVFPRPLSRWLTARESAHGRLLLRRLYLRCSPVCLTIALIVRSKLSVEKIRSLYDAASLENLSERFSTHTQVSFWFCWRLAWVSTVRINFNNIISILLRCCLFWLGKIFASNKKNIYTHTHFDSHKIVALDCLSKNIYTVCKPLLYAVR